ncbi:MAG: hypothetical protein AAF968_05585 [Pseudomonadota bacterium]
MFKTLRRLIYLFLAVVIFGPIAVLFFGREDAPAIGPDNVVSSAQAGRFSRVLNEFRAITRGDAAGPLKVEAADLESAVALGARVIPGLRGDARIGPGPDGVEEIMLTVAVPIPFIEGAGWYNLSAAVPESEDGVGFSRVAVGPIEVPGGWIVPLGAMVLDVALGGESGDLARSAVGAVRVSGGQASLDIDMDKAGRNALAGRFKDTVRGLAFASKPEDVAAYLAAFDAAAASGKRFGTQLAPHVALALRTAADRVEAGGKAQAEAEAMLFALGLDCGTWSMQLVLGDVVPDGRQGAPCAAAKLSGRDDLRKHFSISAALAAAADGAGSFAVGEAKELVDSDGGSGFSFDDLMADRAGIRFAEIVMAGGPADWRALADRIGRDRDILPEHRDLPSGMTAQAFERTYRDVESTAYKDMVRRIDARIASDTVLGAS